MNIERSMFDVQSFHCSGQAEFHTSNASGLKNGQSDRKRNSAIFGLVSYAVSGFNYLTPPS
jgi:hypothetical protein